MKTLASLSLLSLLTACAAARPAPVAVAPAATPPSQSSATAARTIRVAGRAHHEVVPDLAKITVGVHDRAESAKDATAANNRHMTKLIAALVDHGVAERAIQTSEFAVHEDYDNRGRIRGFVVTNLVTIEVADLRRTGEVLDAAVEAGANQVHGISFGLADPHHFEQAALERAMADARTRGEVLARTASGALGDVIAIDTVTPPSFQPHFLGATEGADVPISPGMLGSDVEVTVVFALNG